MDFGKTENVDSVDFTLPPDHRQTTQLFERLKNRPTKGIQVYIGCAKWGRKDWIGQLYPRGTKEKDFFAIYAKNFNAIELNATHYRIPSSKTVLDWKSRVDKGFKFSPKFPQTISHYMRLRNAEDATNIFYDAIRLLGENLGEVFLQLPPNFGPKNHADFERYISNLHTDVNVCVEFRHKDWFSDLPEAREAWQMMEEKKVGSVITDAAGRRDCVHQILTTDTAFIRFVGNSLHPSDYSRIDSWVKRLKKWLENGLKTLYFYMHQHEERYSPVLCDYFIQQMNKECGLRLKRPELINAEGKLFA